MDLPQLWKTNNPFSTAASLKRPVESRGFVGRVVLQPQGNSHSDVCAPARCGDAIHARCVTLLFALLNRTQQVPAHDGYASITGGAFLDTALTSSHPLCRAYRFA